MLPKNQRLCRKGKPVNKSELKFISCHVTGYTSGVPATQVTGHLYFRKVTPETMSGTFYVKIGEVMEISYGRFDYRLSVIDLDLR